jgi:hypothetical protein
MNQTTRTYLELVRSADKLRQNEAFSYLLAATEQPVDWAYEAWDEVLGGLTHKSNRVRAISAQVLCNLAKSDPQGRMLQDLDALLNVTRDERFVTARHTLQAIWKVGAAGPLQRQKLVEGLVYRFAECSQEKNSTLIRYDIIQALRNLYDATGDENIKRAALSLVEAESDEKYRRKYAGLWKGN